ncbi:MAG: cytochrome c-type biogenesis protein CcmH [Longimicrobiales bacterium]|nr:cytochrome c-type biogenesis protein CcmH [Longimicrobiales bacterium]
MKRLNTMAVLAAGSLALAAAMPAQGQTAGPQHEGYDPTAPVGGHYHEGELGEKLMLVETALKCNCGCGLDVHSCQFQMQCGTSPVWSQRIRQQLEAGESVEAVKASFVADYGTEVLMRPPAEGFNLLGYFLPAMAILAAGALVGMVARGNATRQATVPAAELSDADQERLQAAMRKLDEEESPDW